MKAQRTQPKWQAHRLAISVLILASVVLVATTVSSAGVQRRIDDSPTLRVLVVGIEKYPALPTVLFAAADATLISRVISSSASSIAKASDVKLVLDGEATSARIRSELHRAKNSLASGQALLIYWAGHSVYDKIANDLFLLPYDATEARATAGNSLSVVNDLAPLSSDGHPVIFVGDTCHVGDGMMGRIGHLYPNFSVMSASKADEFAFGFKELGHGPFSYHLAEALSTPAPDLDGDGLLSLEEIHHFLFPRVIETGRRLGPVQHPSIAGALVHRAWLGRADIARSSTQIDSIPTELADGGRLEINGYRSDARVDQAGSLLFLSDTDKQALKPGVNVITAGKRAFVYWLEQGRLKAFKEPYDKSRALLVAIDDYDRTKDRQRRGPTGFRALSGMVERAEELRRTLLSLGFADDNIRRLYDQDATSAAIESVLAEYWLGGTNAKTNRLFLYIGGHGFTVDGRGLVATYDYDRNRPTMTSLQMDDLRSRQARNIVAHHVLIALDVCYSGLTHRVLTLGDPGQQADKEFAQLSVVRMEVEDKARNLLLAGTGEQRALWENGGIFTQALIAGLRGRADGNRDGLIQFHELAGFVRNEVTNRAAQTGVRQDPSDFILDEYGKGRVLFVRGDSGGK